MNRLLLIIGVLSMYFQVKAQAQESIATQAPKTELTLAHEKKIPAAAFTATDKQLFRVKVFPIKEIRLHKRHHWFLKIETADGAAVNYANIELEGYLKRDPSIQLSYYAPVFPLCSEGKYIIGRAKFTAAEEWVLHLVIENSGVVDTIDLVLDLGLLVKLKE